MLVEQIHAYLRKGAGYERVQVGPFLATFTPGSDHPMRNYAVPDDGSTPSAADIAELVTCYRGRGLRPRLEYLTARLMSDGRPVGSGLYPVRQMGVTEIAAVGVIGEHRGRGVAGAIIGLLAHRALQGGAHLVWLTAEDRAEQRAAEAAGLTRTGAEMLFISLPPKAS